MIRLSQLVASSTARWFREIMRTSRATAAAVTPTMVEMPSSWPYRSCMMLENLVQIVSPVPAARAVWVMISAILQHMAAALSLTLARRGPFGFFSSCAITLVPPRFRAQKKTAPEKRPERSFQKRPNANAQFWTVPV